MTLRKPKKENMIALFLFTVVMMLKICAVVALCSRHHAHAALNHDFHTHHEIKKNKILSCQTNGHNIVL
ncbi:MAG: hypothetical protein P4L31_06205 [Candidatus Babeliales bacterium]|nr:hypothetical protein [Candidatus Babeliales bacterium]